MALPPWLQNILFGIGGLVISGILYFSKRWYERREAKEEERKKKATERAEANEKFIEQQERLQIQENENRINALEKEFTDLRIHILEQLLKQHK